VCGAEGNRTPGLLDATEALYQLSYSPWDTPGTSAQGVMLPVTLAASTLETALDERNQDRLRRAQPVLGLVEHH
jgi:hypothetical protein